MDRTANHKTRVAYRVGRSLKANTVAFALGVGWLGVGPEGGAGGCECV